MNQARESRSLAKRSTPSVVMAGLVPAIHAVVQTTRVDDFIPSFMHEFVEIRPAVTANPYPPTWRGPLRCAVAAVSRPRSS